MEWLQYLPSIITAVGAIVIAWFTYNQYTKNKKTDLEIEQIKNEDKRKNKKRSDNAMIIYGELWDVLVKTHADRVYIVQPHPLGNEDKLTIYFEVKRKGVEGMKPHVQQMKVCEVATFARGLATTMYQSINNIEEQVEDKYVRSILSLCGTKGTIVCRLSDNKYDWVGSVFCDFSDDMVVKEDEAQKILHTCATTIQYILPPIED